MLKVILKKRLYPKNKTTIMVNIRDLGSCMCVQSCINSWKTHLQAKSWIINYTISKALERL